METEFIADVDSQGHTGQRTGCRHVDAEAVFSSRTQTLPTEGRRLVALPRSKRAGDKRAEKNNVEATSV